MRIDDSNPDNMVSAVVKVEWVTRGKSHKGQTKWEVCVWLPDAFTDGPRNVLIIQQFPDAATPDEWKRVPVSYNRGFPDRVISVDVEKLASMDPTEPLVVNDVWQAGVGFTVAGPRWIVPHECPNCGGIVDQAKQGMADDPACTFCGQPLPVQPASATPPPG